MGLMNRKPQTSAQRRHRQALRVVRLIIINWLLGAAVGCGFAGLLLWFDIAGLRSLMMRSDMMIAALALLFGGFAVTFGSLVAGTAVMLINRDDDPPDDPPRGRRQMTPQLARVRAVARG